MASLSKTKPSNLQIKARQYLQLTKGYKDGCVHTQLKYKLQFFKRNMINTYQSCLFKPFEPVIPFLKPVCKMQLSTPLKIRVFTVLLLCINDPIKTADKEISTL